MDYDILNSAIDDIVWIVNQYNKKHNYNVALCERLVLALLGYYLNFGPEIFTKIDTVLDALLIHQCDTKSECEYKKVQLCPYLDIDFTDWNPATVWDYKYEGEKKKFIGAVPNIVFFRDDLLTDVCTLIHEISHVLEGVKAEIIGEDENFLKLKHGYATVRINKTTNGFWVEGLGMTELITVTIETHALKKLTELDFNRITNPFVSSFIKDLGKYRNYNIMSKSYRDMVVLFKDLIDSEYFFELIKKYYYENQQELLLDEYNSLDERLDFSKLVKYADIICRGQFDDLYYYCGPIQSQLDVLNEVTKVEPDTRILIMV